MIDLRYSRAWACAVIAYAAGLGGSARKAIRPAANIEWTAAGSGD